MTGEISLRGLVLPVGGIKEKVMAAKRAGVRHILLPALNRKDLQELPSAARDALRFEFLERVEDVLALALEPTDEEKEISAPDHVKLSRYSLEATMPH